MQLPRLCVFCGSRPGDNPAYADAARAVGRALGAAKLGLVYGGGHVGLMGILADAALEAGSEVTGVIPSAMVEDELAHRRLTHLHVVNSMHERKALMASLAHAFLALPGGFGTAEEFFEVVTWRQLRLHRKPIGLLNVAGFFDLLLAWIDRAFADGLIADKHRGLIVASADPAALVAELLTPTPPAE